MFNLEQAITEWRRQMLVAGIKSTATLEELENHLREEIEQQMKSGMTGHVAFHSARQTIGQANLLKKEFDQAGGIGGWLGHNKIIKTDRILGTLWVAQGVWYLNDLFPLLVQVNLSSRNWPNWGCLILAIALAVALAAVWGGVCLIRGTKSGRTIIGFIAMLGVSVCPLQMPLHLFNTSTFSAWITLFAAFDLITLWVVFSPKQRNSEAAK
jgi:hypothetical protein